jgi:hypothetical protein
MEDPRVLLRQMATGMRTAQALYVATELGVADHLSNGPMSSSDLAMATRAHAGAIRRLMRALSALGVFAEDTPDHFSLTKVGDHLRSDHPRSLRSGTLFLTGPLRWQLWSDLLESVRTGEPATERLFGCNIFDYYSSHPADEAIMNEAMRANTDLVSRAVVTAFNFSRFRTVMDIGGGTGDLIGSILAAHPQLQGILVDRSQVVAAARPVLEQHGVSDRCVCIPGDFFNAVPPGADVIMLKNVVHDWDDARALRLLACCREGMPEDGTLLIIERVLPERAEGGMPVDPFLADLEMMVGAGGRERTEDEYRALLSVTGLTLVSVTPAAYAFSLIEARLA